MNDETVKAEGLDRVQLILGEMESALESAMTSALGAVADTGAVKVDVGEQLALIWQAMAALEEAK